MRLCRIGGSALCWALTLQNHLSFQTAGELALDWLRKIHVERGGLLSNFAKWLSDGKHGINELPPNTNITDIAAIAAAYPAIYHAKWRHDPAQGHAEIERHIEASRPSYGYYALAEILASDDPENPSRHNVVITPNFDNLPAETLGALGKKIPMVIGHSAIADFARPTLRRPLIIKFHHDFLLAPKSDPKDVGNLEQGYEKALAEIFRLYTPIVIGYGGNDGSLMGLLEKLPGKSIPGGILWCWRKGDEPGSRIQNVVARQKGTLIEISGFDELMTLLEKSFGHVFNPDKLRERAEARAKDLAEAKQRLTKKAESDLSPSATSGALGARGTAPVTAASSEESFALLDALSATAAISNPTESKKTTPLPWWRWQERINAATDLEEKERLFKQGLEATQNAAPLLGNYALFLDEQRKDYDRAEEYYLKALAADPNDANNYANYVQFLIGRERFDDATLYASQAWFRISDWKTECVGEIAFSRWLLAVVAGKDGSSALGRLKTFLQTGCDRFPWSFDAMLAACLPKLSKEKGALACKLAAAILDQAKLAELNADPTWSLVQAIPLDTPWPDDRSIS